MFGQLPQNVQTSLNIHFLHQNFIVKFRDFFRLKRPLGVSPISDAKKMNLRVKVKTEPIKKLFFDWTDLDYRKFMLQLCSLIEPRFEPMDTYLLDEFDEAQEILFVNKGKIAIGFYINKSKQVAVIKKDLCLIGAYSLIFDERS